MARPKLVLTRTTPSLFLPQSLYPLQPLLSALKQTTFTKLEAFKLLFSNPHARFPLDIPDTLLKSPAARQAIYLAVDSKGFLVCEESRAEDSFFRNSFAVHMMNAFVRPSPFLKPKFVVELESGVVFCKDQAEVLRLMEGAGWYLVQRFVHTKEQRAQKFRVKWNAGEHVSIKLLYKNRLYPYNTPNLHTAGHSRGETPLKCKKRRYPTPSLLEPPHKLKFLEESHIHGPSRTSPFSVSFSANDEECICIEQHRQETEDQAALLLNYLRELMETAEETLQAAEFDIMQGQSRWFFLNLKSVTTAKRQERVPPHTRPLRFGTGSHCRNKSGDEARREIKELLRLDRSFVAKPTYIDLDEVQDRNIRLYAYIKDSLSGVSEDM